MGVDDTNDQEQQPPRAQSASDAFGFGPLGGIEALTSLQRQGLAAASEVAERFTSMLGGFDPWAFTTPSDQTGNGSTARDASDGDPEGAAETGDRSEPESFGDLRANIARGFDMYSRMFQTTFEAWADMVEDQIQDRGIQLRPDAADDGVATGPAGGTATGDLWLHNHTSETVGPLHLIATPGFAANGQTIGPAEITIAPNAIEVAPESSSRINVSIDITGQVPGVLHVLILVNELPDEALPLRVVITDPDNPHNSDASDDLTT